MSNRSFAQGCGKLWKSRVVNFGFDFAIRCKVARGSARARDMSCFAKNAH